MPQWNDMEYKVGWLLCNCSFPTRNDLRILHRGRERIKKNVSKTDQLAYSFIEQTNIVCKIFY